MRIISVYFQKGANVMKRCAQNPREAFWEFHDLGEHCSRQRERAMMTEHGCPVNEARSGSMTSSPSIIHANVGMIDASLDALLMARDDQVLTPDGNLIKSVAPAIPICEASRRLTPLSTGLPKPPDRHRVRVRARKCWEYQR